MARFMLEGFPWFNHAPAMPVPLHCTATFQQGSCLVLPLHNKPYVPASKMESLAPSSSRCSKSPSTTEQREAPSRIHGGLTSGNTVTSQILQPLIPKKKAQVNRVGRFLTEQLPFDHTQKWSITCTLWATVCSAVLRRPPLLLYDPSFHARLVRRNLIFATGCQPIVLTAGLMATHSSNIWSEPMIFRVCTTWDAPPTQHFCIPVYQPWLNPPGRLRHRLLKAKQQLGLRTPSHTHTHTQRQTENTHE